MVMEIVAQLFLVAVLVALGYGILLFHSWKLPQFTAGVMVMRFGRSFNSTVPPEIVGRFVETDRIAFLFCTRDRCLFRLPNSWRYRFRFQPTR